MQGEEMNPEQGAAPGSHGPVGAYFFGAQAPHLALQALHFDIILDEPHLAPPQARQAMAQPLKAAVVTTAAARLSDRREESDDMVVLQ